jgi:hypothetical protein
MPFIPAPNVAQVEVRGTIGESNVENVLYFLNTTPPVTLAEIESLANDIDQFWYNRMQALLPSGYSYRETYAMDLSNETGPTYTATNGVWQGTRLTTGGMMPNNATIAVSFRTAQRGRSHRGRNYVTGLSRNDVTGNIVSQALQTLLVEEYNSLRAGEPNSPTGWIWVVLSRRANNAWRAQGLTTTIQRVVIVDGIIDTQRRRLPGRGN